MDKSEIKTLLHEVLDEREDILLGISPREHYDDHRTISEWKKESAVYDRNHRFVNSVISSAEIAKKASIRTAITALITFFIGAIIYFLRRNI